MYKWKKQYFFLCCFLFAPPVRSLPGRPLPRYCRHGAGSAGRRMDRRAGCAASARLSERRVRGPSIQTQGHPQKQAQAKLSGFWGCGSPNSSNCSSPSHSYTYLCRQGSGRRNTAATSDGKGDWWKQWEAQERGRDPVLMLQTLNCLVHICAHNCSLICWPSLFQDEMLSELLAEMKALRAVVLAQNQRIELLERQLARIEDGDVWGSIKFTIILPFSWRNYRL